MCQINGIRRRSFIGRSPIVIQSESDPIGVDSGHTVRNSCFKSNSSDSHYYSTGIRR